MKGGYRVGSGRPKGSKNKQKASKMDIKGIENDGSDVIKPVAEDITPLDFMLSIMRDPDTSPAVRRQMAISAAPYLHARMSDNRKGKKDDALEKAKKAGTGKYAQSKPPLNIIEWPGK